MEKEPEITEIVESNYRVARRVYHHLWVDISELLAEFIQSVPTLDLHDMDEDIKINVSEIKAITDVENSLDLINIFQTFYQITGRLPFSDGLLVVLDCEPPPGEDSVNMNSLYDMFRHTNSHGLVSLPFLGVLQYCLEKNDFP